MKTDIEKVRDRLAEAEALAEKICEELLPDCDNCPFSIGRDDCGKNYLHWTRRAVQNYENRQDVLRNTTGRAVR